MYSTYVLRSESRGQFYIGSTSDLGVRLQQHNDNLAPATKNRGPWKLVYSEDHVDRSSAVRRERYFKTGKGRDELKRLVETPPQGR
jgi:putative endonuclease